MTSVAKRLLVPLDGYPASEAVLPLAEALARDTGAVVRLVGVVGPEADTAPDAAVGAPAETPPTDPGGYLARRAGALRARGLARVFWSLWYGEPAPTIVRVAAQSRVDAVIVSGHGRASRGRLPLGSVAEHLLRAAPTPVLLLLEGDRPVSVGIRDGILVPLDGSAAAAEILPTIGRLAAALAAPLTLLRVIEPAAGALDPDEVHAALRVEAEEDLARAAKELEARDLEVRRIADTGPPADVILDRARRHGAGLIAMTTGVHRDRAAPPLGSVAARVMGHATVPLLFWRSAPVQASY